MHLLSSVSRPYLVRALAGKGRLNIGSHIPGRIFLVIGPALGVGLDVIAEAAKGVVGVDDMFIIITLPDGRAQYVPQGVDAFGGDGFELANGGTGVWPAWG